MSRMVAGMTFRQFAGIVELRTKIVSLGTYTLAALYVLWTRSSINLLDAAMLLAAALAVDMGTTGFNSYFDWYRNVDDARFNREEGKVLVHEGVSPGAALGVSAACFALAMALGTALAFRAGFAVLVAGGASLLVGFLYSAGPRPLSSTPLGELFAGGFLGTVFFLIAVRILGGAADWRALLASLPQCFCIGAILSANNACDIKGDAASGRRTLAIKLGPALAPLAIYVQLAAAWCAGLGLAAAGIAPRALALTLPVAALPAFLTLAAMRARGYSHLTKGPTMGGISRIFILMDAAWVLGYLLELALPGVF